MGIPYMLEMTFFVKHQQQHRHLEEAPEGTPHGQIPTLDQARRKTLSYLPTQKAIDRITRIGYLRFNRLLLQYIQL